MKKLFLILAMLLVLASNAMADCWIGVDYGLDPNAQSAALWMLPENVSIGALPVPPIPSVVNIPGITSVTGKTFFIRQTFLGGITNDNTAAAATPVMPAVINHILSGCE